jgi:hypothetical protein
MGERSRRVFLDEGPDWLPTAFARITWAKKLNVWLATTKNICCIACFLKRLDAG